MDLLYVKYAPRWKWFRPPMWKIFMWAYRITEAKKLIDCKPTGPSHSQQEIEVSIKGYEVRPGTVSEALTHWLNGLKED